MKIGEIFHGFKLVSVTPVEELSAKLHLFRHEKTGAELLWTGREDENKTFSVAFQTIPEDDTGVFHILEHSVLCGSDKYPVREPFVELLKGSLNTFLNAMTFPDKTVYPVSSRNDADFENLMHVYLDAVFCPAIYHNENIFRQEGWHLETDEKGEPRLVGVVYGEMKGAFSSVDEIIETNIMRRLFPDSCYGFVSGGDPKHIPELTYEAFLQQHRRFYHPSNARLFLDGSVDLPRALALIDGEYLDRYERREPDFAPVEQKPVAYSETTVCYAAAPGENKENQAHFVMGRQISTWKDVEKNLALAVLQDYLAGSNNAPFTRAVLEKGLGQDFRLSALDGIAQNPVMLEVRNTSADKLPGMKAALIKIGEEILEKGLDRDELTASLNRVEFHLRERKEPFGVQLAIRALQSWLYGGDPALYFRANELFASLRGKLDGTYFEDLFREVLFGDDGLVVLNVLPSETLAAETMADESERSKAMFDGLSEVQKQKLKEDLQSLAVWQQTPDSPEALATIPHLSLSDIPLEPVLCGVKQEKIGDVRVLRPDVSGDGIVYLHLYFALPGIRVEDLPVVSLMTQLLGELPTAHRDVTALQRDIKSNLGVMKFSADIISHPGDCDHCVPYLHAYVSVLKDKVREAVRLLREVLCETDFDRAGKIREIVQQMTIMQQQGIITAGHQFAICHALAGQTAENTAREYIGGYGCYDYIRKTAAKFDEVFPALKEQMTAFMRYCTAANLTLGVTGEVDDDVLASLCTAFPAGSAADPTMTIAVRTPARDAILVPAGIAYAACGINFYRLGLQKHGSLMLLSKLLSLNYLWNEVRVQGGAYGAGLGIAENGNVCCYSFRDPNPARTLGIYRAAADFLRKQCEDRTALDQLIIGAVSDSEPLQGAGAKTQSLISRVLLGVTEEDIKRARRELLSATHEDLAKLCDLLSAMSAQGGVCVVGNEAFIDACGDVFDDRLQA